MTKKPKTVRVGNIEVTPITAKERKKLNERIKKRQCRGSHSGMGLRATENGGFRRPIAEIPAWEARREEKVMTEPRQSMQQILQLLGRRIRSERQRKSMSQEGFAEICGLHRTEMGLLERGKTIPRLDTLLIVSEQSRNGDIGPA